MEVGSFEDTSSELKEMGISEDKIHYSQGESQSAVSCLLGEILYKDTWDMSEKAMDIEISTKAKSKNNMWLVSVYID